MDKITKHSIIQSILISLLVYLKNKYAKQGDKLELAHACHYDSGRKDVSEELVYRTQGYRDFVRIRVDIVDEEYGNVMLTEQKKIEEELREGRVSPRDLMALALLERITGIKFR